MTEVNNNYYGYDPNDEMLNFKIMDNIAKQLKAQNTSGKFKAEYRIKKESNAKSEVIRVRGCWRILPDYILFYRIHRWWYNCNIAPEKVESLFTKAFGHNSQKCIDAFEHTYNRNIFDFIGYIGDMKNYGYAFMDIIMQEMETYEKKHSLPVD
jgi:hypothetical protein